jgi:hypothetical protein
MLLTRKVAGLFFSSVIVAQPERKCNMERGQLIINA